MPAESRAAGRAENAELAAAFRTSDAAAVEIIATRLAPLVQRLVRRLTAWAGDADDLVQDVLVAALAARAKFRGQSTLETWITRVTVNCVRAHRRKQWVRSRLFGGWTRGLDHGDAGEPPSDLGAELKEQAQRVREAVARLPRASRETIVLHYLEEMTVDETAAALNVRRGTVEVRLTRARRQLRELLSLDPETINIPANDGELL